MGSITEIEDKLAIRELIARYSFAIDSGDIKAWVDCFTEDGAFESPFGTFKGSTALHQYISERTAERRSKQIQLRHLLTNIIIDIQGNRAKAKCYLLLLLVMPEGVQLLTTGVYNDELRKMGGAWRFSHRKVEFDTQTWASQVFPSSYLKRSELEQKIKKSN